ncbi:response regulator [Bacillus dakarensis]|uniref:response regulator n=1 Tax=Robertmurraya dakarensis TaxID=1926278 RepID=UPI000981F891|nr:response regulator [Bacillus dakarensis]
MIKVFIVEDDPMVAELNKKFVDSLEGFQTVGVAGSVMDAARFLESNIVDLILLDVYMPGGTGLELLRIIRENDKKIDVILITAASDLITVQDAVRLGAIDYLIKPFSFIRLSEALHSYQDRKSLMKGKRAFSQAELDKSFFSKQTSSTSKELPKGLTKPTLRIILTEMKKLEGIAFESEELAKKTGISSVSVRKYLNFLSEINALDARVYHGSVGRPSIHFLYKAEDECKIAEFF